MAAGVRKKLLQTLGFMDGTSSSELIGHQEGGNSGGKAQQLNTFNVVLDDQKSCHNPIQNLSPNLA